jgi:PAS domain S-box-containing protein
MRFTFLTPSVQQLLGYTPEEVIGIGPSVTLPPASLQIVSQALTEELAREAAHPGTGGRRRLLLEQNRKGGGTVWTEVNTSFLRDETGKVIAVAGVTRDYTVRREAELLERRLREELEQRVLERTAELQALNQRLEAEIVERRRAQREALMAVEQERHRLGQDLHDDLCQRLVGAMCLAKSLEDPGLKHREPALARGMATIHDILAQALEQARMLARGLCALPFDTDRLEDALQLLAQDSRRLYAIKCRYSVKGPIPEFPPGTAIYLVRIAQEAINNAVRHGRADHVDLILRGTPTHVTLDIKDNGVGIRGDPFAKPGLGVRNMRSRAEMLQGTLVIEPVRTGGTRVSCAIPLDRLPRP